jgi:exodeoxyribonuclease V alpha subunit
MSMFAGMRLLDIWYDQTTSEQIAFEVMSAANSNRNIDPKVARKAVEFWGEEAVAKIRDNPYRLLAVCSWDQADRSASALDFAPDDGRRLVAAVESVLYDRLDRKHTWTSRNAVIRATARRLRASSAAAEAALDLAVADGAAIPTREGYQAAGAAYMERFIEDRVQSHIEARGARNDLFLGSIDRREVEAFLYRFSAEQAQPLTSEQASAVRMVLANTFSLLVGGAGVGKTTALRAINAASRVFGFAVYQLAVAGRAAQRIAEATGQPAQTIASWLAAVSEGRLEVGSHTLVIVDEASMLDLPTLYRILFHLPEEAPLLLVGDVAQLPPIGFGLTLHRLVECTGMPKTELTRILRSDDSTGIPKASIAVRAGKLGSLPSYKPQSAGCCFIEARLGEIIHRLEDIRNDLRDEELQVIAPTYAGEAGIDAINRHFHRANALGKPTLGQFAPGDPCLWTVNDYERSLWNGSLGRVLEVSRTALVAEIDGTVHTIQVSELDRLELAYCISVHKAQGSQFDNVVMPVVPSFNFDRTMLYTGLTRAIRRAILVGSKAVLARTVADEPRSLARDVGLAWEAIPGAVEMENENGSAPGLTRHRSHGHRRPRLSRSHTLP